MKECEVSFDTILQNFCIVVFYAFCRGEEVIQLILNGAAGSIQGMEWKLSHCKKLRCFLVEKCFSSHNIVHTIRDTAQKLNKANLSVAHSKFAKNLDLEVFDDALSFAIKKYRGQNFREYGPVGRCSVFSWTVS